ncbi:MAG TPA: ABC transporter permease subunit, partial [Acidimicrobiia bacterium]|nr:ABC transporter permease subunit [Acidimicrobiia bacterium]
MDRHRRALTRAAALLPAVVPVLFIALFFVWPVIAVFARAVRPHAIGDVLGDGGLRHIMWFTFWQAAVSTAITVTVGLPVAFVLARFRFRGRALIRTIITIPFVMPTVVVAAAFLALLRPGGPLAFLGWQRGVGPLLLAHVFFNIAVVVRVVGAYWSNLDPRTGEAARMLGATRARVFTDVTLPLLAPAIAGAAAVVFLFTFTSFGAALLLADPAHATIEVEVYRQAFFQFDLTTAAALALLQLVAVIAALGLMTVFERRGGVRQRIVASSESARPPRRGQRVGVALVLAIAIAALAGPLVLLAIRSVHVHGRWTLAAYRALGSSASSNALFVSPWTALRNSVLFAVVAAIIAVLVGGLAAM